MSTTDHSCHYWCILLITDWLFQREALLFKIQKDHKIKTEVYKISVSFYKFRIFCWFKKSFVISRLVELDYGALLRWWRLAGFLWDSIGNMWTWLQLFFLWEKGGKLFRDEVQGSCFLRGCCITFCIGNRSCGELELRTVDIDRDSSWR